MFAFAASAVVWTTGVFPRWLAGVGNGNTVDYTYYLDGLLKTQTEKKPAGAVVASHDLAYTPNGDKARDISLVMDADNHANLLDRTTVYTYDPLDRIATVTKTDTSSGASVSSESYKHDAANHVTEQTINGTATTFTYDRSRMQKSLTGTTTALYNYDPFGRLDAISASGQVIESYDYDGFDRIAEHASLQGGSTDTTKYVYDPRSRPPRGPRSTAAPAPRAGAPGAAAAAATAHPGPPAGHESTKRRRSLPRSPRARPAPSAAPPPGLQGQQGLRGPQGPPGQRGYQGLKGPRVTPVTAVHARLILRQRDRLASTS